MPLSHFLPSTRRWFQTCFSAPTEVQERGWPTIARKEHALLIAPTGSGKTLAAFLYTLDALARSPKPAPGVQLVYVSPLKALVYDIERNLRAPLSAITEFARAEGEHFTAPRVAMRTGDTPPKERRKQAKHPCEILVTTPESLYLILGSAQGETLRSAKVVIVDEVHALAGTKRGAHLALSLERLARIAHEDPQRIGLSATVNPVSEAAAFLGGDRAVTVVDASAAPLLDLQIRVPKPEAFDYAPASTDHPAPAPGPDGPPQPVPSTNTQQLDSAEGRSSIWPAIYPELLAAVRSHRSSIIFVNSRGLCERLCQKLNERAGEPLLRAHHGSVSHAQRQEIEEALKGGMIRGIVATSSLELGIDMDAVDLVLMVESPLSATSGLQRIGRAGHGVGQVSKGIIFPKHAGDLLEATVVARQMVRGEIETVTLPRLPLDVLAQQVVATCATEPIPLSDLQRMVTRAAHFSELPPSLFRAVVDMLVGRYPSTAFADLRPHLSWDRQRDLLEGRRHAKSLAATNGGTIPDRGQYGVYLAPDGPRLGELDEEMVHETLPGQTFALGSSNWRVEQVTRDRVLVSPAPGEIGKLPFWHGEGPGRPVALGRAIGAFVRELATKPARERQTWLQHHYRLDPQAAQNLVAYVEQQQRHTQTLPTDQAITVEQFRDELGDWRICIHCPLGARVLAPWSLAIEERLSREAGLSVQTLFSDDGIVLRLADGDAPPPLQSLLVDPEEIEELVIKRLADSALFAGQFRENAARSLLLPRRRPGARTPLWAQRVKAQSLQAVARQYPDFPIMLETYRSCLKDVFDMPALREQLQRIQRREIHVDFVETKGASPFARSLVFALVAAQIYEVDTPPAERRAQALSLDRKLLSDLLGAEELRELLDADVITEVEQQLQCASDGYRARSADELEDVLRRVGDLRPTEQVARTVADPERWIDDLQRQGRALLIHIAGESRLVAADDAPLFHHALGVPLPPGVDAHRPDGKRRSLEELLLRFARSHGPFTAETVATRFGLGDGTARSVLGSLVATGELLEGAFHPKGKTTEFCDPEVLRRIKRRTLARLRDEIAPVPGENLARFLPFWHKIGVAGPSTAQLTQALTQLEGLSVPLSILENELLPARVTNFDPRQLDELGARGELVWVGRGSGSKGGPREGRIALFRRDRITALLDPPKWPTPLDPLSEALLRTLKERGACFFSDLLPLLGSSDADEVAGALWELCWAGLVTNDTLLPLRALRAPSRRGRLGHSSAGGRWSLVEQLLVKTPDPTERAHVQATMLLERYGVLCREAVSAEGLTGGFSAIYPMLKEMEERGKARRGYFVEGVAGMQFALPGAVEGLRATRTAVGSTAGALLLSAVDPANVFGTLLPWPPTRSIHGLDHGSPSRRPGAHIALHEGEPVLFLEAGGKQLLTFPRAGDGKALQQAIAALTVVAARRRGRYLRLETIDGMPALDHPDRSIFEGAGYRMELKGLVLEARPY